MNQTGRRIASVVATLLLCVSVAGAGLCAAFAQESEEGNLPTTERSELITERPSTDPVATTQDGSETDPETPSTEEGTTTLETDLTGPTTTTTDELPIETTSPETAEGTGTELPTDSPTTDEPPLTTTEPPETQAPAKVTKAPSRDPALGDGATVSEGQIPLSTDKDGSPAGTGGSAAERDPANPADGTFATDAQGNPTIPFPGEADSGDSSGQANGIPQIAAICSVFAILSGAVLVLLKFIR